MLHSHPEIEISFKFIPKILMSKECIHFFGLLCIYDDGLKIPHQMFKPKDHPALTDRDCLFNKHIFAATLHTWIVIKVS